MPSPGGSLSSKAVAGFGSVASAVTDGPVATSFTCVAVSAAQLQSQVAA